MGGPLVTVGCNGRLYDECAIYNNQEERQEAWIVQQDTGLQDKDGQNIYEGDLLQFAYRDDGVIFVGEVKYCEEFACFIVVVGNAFETFQDLVEYASSFKVKGNVCENKENLEK